MSSSNDDYYEYDYDYSGSESQKNKEPEKIFSVIYPEIIESNDTEDVSLIQRNTAPNVFDSPEIIPDQSISNDNSMESNSDNPKYASYLCKRSYRSHLNSRILFSFKFENNIILYAKSRGPGNNSIYISSNPDIHIKSKQYEYILSIMNHSKKYILKEVNSDEELMIIHMDNDYGIEYGPRKIKIFWPQDNLEHVSRIPHRNRNGWSLKFGKKFVITSKKNAIILDENAKPSLLVRKIEKKVLQVEVNRKYKPIYLFAIAIASFICPF